MKAEKVILSRLLPKTGQVTSYRLGDDGYFEAGWWKKRLITDNKTRFIAKTIDNDDVIIDRATGLMWTADGDGRGGSAGESLNWNDAIDYALGINFANFTDWRLPNVKELVSLIEYEAASPFFPTGFVNIYSGLYWTSTTFFLATTNAWLIDLGSGLIDPWIPKTGLFHLMCVRGGV